MELQEPLYKCTVNIKIIQDGWLTVDQFVRSNQRKISLKLSFTLVTGCLVLTSKLFLDEAAQSRNLRSILDLNFFPGKA